jgi:hypothetical protein
MDETAFNLFPSRAIFNLGYQKSVGAKSGEYGGGDKNGDNSPYHELEEKARKMRRYVVLQKILGPTFMQLRPNEMIFIAGIFSVLKHSIRRRNSVYQNDASKKQLET